MSAEKYYNSIANLRNDLKLTTQLSKGANNQQYNAPSGPPPGFQQQNDGQRGFNDYNQQQQYYQQGPPQQQYYQQGPPQQGYYQQQQPVYVQQQPQQQRDSSNDCCLACLGALCVCCALDAIF